mmetsp:Transcript_2486/g.7335  ORF Transcript_2486/g.7335 Transcript_2486/m.7335 type:complete len:227 (+) Transcript_2486:958-1638(+)
MSMLQTRLSCSSKVAAHSAVRMCHSFSKPSAPLDINCMPFARKHTRRTALPCPWKARSVVKSLRFHSRTVWSPEAEAMTWSTGEKATCQIPRRCPLHSPRRSASGKRQIRINLSWPPEATTLLFGATVRSLTSLAPAMTVTLAFSMAIGVAPVLDTDSSCGSGGNSQIFIVLSSLPVARHHGGPPPPTEFGPFGLFLGKETAETEPACPVKTHTHLQVDAFQTRRD